MPIGATVVLSGSVAAASSPATLTGSVEVAGPLATVVGTVSRAQIDAVEGASLYYRARVRLGGEWVPEEDLVGDVEISESIDTIGRSATFSLRGRRWGVAATLSTWTRTPVEIWTGSGTAADFREELRLAGYTVTSEQSGFHEPILKVTVGDQWTLFDRQDLCYELEPGAGLTRDQICADLLASVGITAFDLLPGARYDKPLVISGSQQLGQYLAEFGEPEGWRFRFRPDGTLESYRPGLKLPPEPPDHVWGPDDVEEVRSTPPRDVASRVVLRGTALVVVDESGLETTLTRTEVKAPYIVRHATEEQLSDGSIVANPAPDPIEFLQTVQIVEQQVTKRGDREIGTVEREYGWRVPAAAKLRTPPDGSPPGPVNGLYYAQCYLIEGAAVAWQREAFGLAGERRVAHRYGPEGRLGTHTQTYRWRRRVAAVKNIGSATYNLGEVAIGDDDQSYEIVDRGVNLLVIEAFGLADEHDVEYEYGASGAVEHEVQRGWTWHSPRVAIEGTTRYLRHDGAAQLHPVAPWTLVSQKDVRHLLAKVGGLLAGRIEVESAWGAPTYVAGAHDWGDRRSPLPQEVFRIAAVRNVRYNVVSSSAYEEIVDTGDGKPEVNLVSGRLPLPRYRSSPWTEMAQQPLELAIDDPVLEAWFGFRREVLNHPHLQSIEEARAMLERKRRREIAFDHRVRRRRTAARPGDTVLLVDPSLGIFGRCLIVEARESWTGASAEADYVLEEPL